MENLKEFEYQGRTLNGFAMLAISFLLWVLSFAVLVIAIIIEDGLMAIPVVVMFLTSVIVSCGFSELEPNEAKVLTFFGRYVGTFRKVGFYWLNPFMSVKKVSLRSRNLNAEPIKVNDKVGNPILIGLVVVWKLNDTYKAIFDIDTDISNTAAAGNLAIARMNKFERFVAIQSDSALREVAGLYAYDNTDKGTQEITLRGGSEEVNEVLTRKLNERLVMAGLEVIEARINYLAYAPEIAAIMLRRQQAAAIISAREQIVEGAVSMVKLALEKLSSEEIVSLTEEKKAEMVGNLLVVLCADEPTHPVINSGAGK